MKKFNSVLIIDTPVGDMITINNVRLEHVTRYEVSREAGENGRIAKVTFTILCDEVNVKHEAG